MGGSSFEVRLRLGQRGPDAQDIPAELDAAPASTHMAPLTLINAKCPMSPTIATVQIDEARMIRFTGMIAVAALLSGAIAVRVDARDLSVGASEYQLSCAGCHGMRGRGNGPMAGSLTKKPTDLTKLEEANDYQFPYLKVFHVIDGRAMLPDHGTRDMPVWGRRYAEDVGDSRGPYGSEVAVRERIEALVQYVQSLQER